MTAKSNFLYHLSLIVGILLFIPGSCKKDEVEPRIPILSTAEVLKIAQITAQSGGVITSDAGFAVTGRGVCWNTSGDPTVIDNKTENGSGAGSFTSQLTGLTIGTTYYVRAYATNSQGTAYGSTVVFETLGNTFTDSRDGNVYKITTIGDQIWVAEDLRYLPNVVGPATASNTTPCYYVYGYYGTNTNEAKATANYTTYGVLYNWPAAMAGSASSELNPSGVQGVSPTGWHLPSDGEWIQLITYLGGTSNVVSTLKETGTTHWKSPNVGATNETGFSALPGGYRGSSGSFYNIREFGGWWSATQYTPVAAKYWGVLYDGNGGGGTNPKELGYSVRCVRD